MGQRTQDLRHGPLGPGPGPATKSAWDMGRAAPARFLWLCPGPMAHDVGSVSYVLLPCPTSYGPVLCRVALSYVHVHGPLTLAKESWQKVWTGREGCTASRGGGD